VLFASEVRCLRRLGTELPRPWLEVGVGTGRFADALNIDVGADPALGVLQHAKRRRIQAVQALGQALPFRDGVFGAVFVIVTLCFADDFKNLLREAARVTRREGRIVLGIVPADRGEGFTGGKAEKVTPSTPRPRSSRSMKSNHWPGGWDCSLIVPCRPSWQARARKRWKSSNHARASMRGPGS